MHFISQECIIVCADIFRKYPTKPEYLNLIKSIVKVNGIDDQRAKSAICWILGEYASSGVNDLFYKSFEGVYKSMNIVGLFVYFYTRKAHYTGALILMGDLQLCKKSCRNRA